jgi:hypothetical protein
MVDILHKVGVRSSSPEKVGHPFRVLTHRAQAQASQEA